LQLREIASWAGQLEADLILAPIQIQDGPLLPIPVEFELNDDEQSRFVFDRHRLVFYSDDRDVGGGRSGPNARLQVNCLTVSPSKCCSFTTGIRLMEASPSVAAGGRKVSAAATKHQ
jgi:hypothetical protein